MSMIRKYHNHRSAYENKTNKYYISVGSGLEMDVRIIKSCFVKYALQILIKVLFCDDKKHLQMSNPLNS